jgi:hypothetical protein
VSVTTPTSPRIGLSSSSSLFITTLALVIHLVPLARNDPRNCRSAGQGRLG